ncbi:MAG TPA: acetylxylan esterase [Planctomycetota bacterium]|nr:acetylxylan esterase [Planctomycetota bacterium]
MLLPLLAALLLAQDDLAARLRELESKVLPEPLPRMLSQDVQSRIREANRRESEAWAGIQTREDWERYKDPRIQALRESLGSPGPNPAVMTLKVTRTLEGRGHRIENLLYESRAGFRVSANLYLPEPPRPSMPGIVIVHSHHNPKTQGELQDMGVMWARAGCCVLIPDLIGHGERRQHPFVDASSYPAPYRVGRQDYFFRYVTGLQLHLGGESLIGWMAWDLMRGVDVLLARPGIDPKRIILLGSVAGGGDPAAVTGALDPRIAAVAPFNFGGPQPETRYPLPDDAEAWFNYAGDGSWESTRNLRLSCRDGFLPWVIVGSIAPRRLIYGHEFSWDRDRDPVWKRFEKIYGLYGTPDRLFAATGKGTLKGQPPEASHCNNIGPEQRRDIHAALLKAFEIPEWEKEPPEKRSSADLACFAAKPRLVHQLLRERIFEPKPERWDALLGGTAPVQEPKLTRTSSRASGDISVESIALEVDAGVMVPLILLLPPHPADARLPLVVGLAQAGKQGFLKERSSDLAALLKAGVAVGLPDLRGSGETKPDSSRGRGSESTDLAASEQMLGRTLLGLRIRDLRSVLRHLRGRVDVDPARIALWGDSFAPANEPERRFEVPLEADGQPALAEPLGGLAALFGGFFEKDVRAVYVRGGLVGYRSILDSPFVEVPYDVIVPGALTAGDLHDLPVASLRVEDLVDGLNRLVPPETVRKLYGDKGTGTGDGPAAWLLKALNPR